VVAESWSLRDFAKTIIWISVLTFVALACPNTLQILSRYEPALGVTLQSAKLPTGSLMEWNASLPWAIGVSLIAAIGIISIGGPSEFLYWQF
jgi:alginate O-acetyltransferase complex protein AlgI